MPITFNLWDLALVAGVSLQATFLAYLPQPERKAFVFGLPIPFTLTALTVGRPIGAANVLGLTLVLLFVQGVRLLHDGLHLAIVPSIVAAALGYCILGAELAPLLPGTEWVFWLTAGSTVLLGLVLLRLLPTRQEPEQRTLLPVWLKLPLIAGVVLLVVMAKNILQGFTTTFPMVGVIAAYESRRSLWTLGRQLPVMMVITTCLMMVCHLVQGRFGLGPGLAAGWAVYLSLYLPYNRAMWAQSRPPALNRAGTAR